MAELREGLRVVDVGEKGRKEWGSEADSNPRAAEMGLNRGHLAYIIYTSGSTGQPKGVMVEHGNVGRLFAATERWFGFNEKDVWTLFHSYAFDFSVWEMWGALLYGGRLMVVEKEERRSPEEYYGMLCREGVTILNQTPTAFQQLVWAQGVREERHSLRCVIFGGEALETGMLGGWYEQNEGEGTQLINMYGITETTVHVTYRELGAEDAVVRRGSPIGRRIADLRMYILDRRGEPVPVGVEGELYVGGGGVARGYQGRAELTGERFVADPYARESGMRMYRTGDVGRWREDGEIEFMGRNDGQVKIRGYRIELGEIEAGLMEQEGVREAVVVAREDSGGDKRLVAYYTSEEGQGGVGAEELRRYLLGRLPEYMVPAAYVRLEELPMTTNGKLNRKGLPAPEEDAYGGRGYEAPVGEAETMLAGVWAEVLKLERVGREENFFELGGDSIRSIMVITKARKLGLKLTPDQMFRYQTIGSVVEAVGREKGTGEWKAEPEPMTLISQADRGKLPEDAEDAYGLTRLQLGMIFHNQYAPQAGVYHDVFSYQLRVREWDQGAFERALEAVVEKHPILRTSIWLNGYSEPLQIVHRRVRIPVTSVDVRGYGEEEQDRMIQEWIEEEKGRGFELEKAPLLRVWLHHRSEKRVQYSMSFHHAILDGWSVASLHTELFQEYARQVKGKGKRKGEEGGVGEEELKSTFRGAVAREREAMQGEGQRGFWGEYLEGHSSAGLPELEEDRRREGERNVRVAVGERERSGLLSLASRLHVPLRTVLLGLHMRILVLLTGQRDVVTGLVSHTRGEDADGEKVLGLFLNTLPFRQRLGRGTWTELIEETFANELRVLPYRRYPYAEMYIENHRATLYETAFNYINFHVYEGLREVGEVEIIGTTGFEATNFGLAVSAVNHGGKLALNLSFAPERLSKTQVERIAGYYRSAMQAVLANPNANHDETEYLSEEERRQVIYEWNETGAEYPRERCVHEMFEEQVRRGPEVTAVVCGEAVISYGELNRRANRLAHYLKKIGVAPGARVGICMERSLELVVAEIAILKCGAAYVAMDPEDPAERKQFMIADSEASHAVTREVEVCPEIAGVRRVKMEVGEEEEGGRENLPMRLGGGSLAYVMYTSGSTGQPKGVMVPHGAILRLVVNNGYVEFGAGDRVGFAANPAFDASTMEVWGPLLNGGKLVIVEGKELLEPERLGEVLRRHEVEILWLTVGLYNVYARVVGEELARLSCLMIGGEAVNGQVIAEMQKRGQAPGRLLNGYGPTETTTFASSYEIAEVEEGSKRVPIGRPIANARIYILDEQMEPAPVGVAGELYIGGAGVGWGYLKRPGMTGECFVADPYAREGGMRMYRTGDIGRWRGDGNIEYVGRNDQQVKIRGYRIEMGEIEARLSEHEGVGEAVVVAREEEDGGKRLVAYYTRGEGVEEVGAEELRKHLSARLPEYMVPVAYVQLEELPLTANGKLDRQGLPAPGGEAYVVRGYEAPEGETEEKVAGVWAEMLKVERVGRQDNFFELGGHSLLALRVITRLQGELSLEVKISDLFVRPVLAEFAAHLVNLQLQQYSLEEIEGLLPLIRSLHSTD
jgi:amino acid adenylation domain-containing protein